MPRITFRPFSFRTSSFAGVFPGRIYQRRGRRIIETSRSAPPYRNSRCREATSSTARPRRADFRQSIESVYNAFCESFNGKLRDECLNANWFASLSDAQRVIEAWRQEYNDVRPHKSLGRRTPAEFIRSLQDQTLSHPRLTA